MTLFRLALLRAAALALACTPAFAFDPAVKDRYPSPDLNAPNVDRLILRGMGSTGAADDFDVLAPGATARRKLKDRASDLLSTADFGAKGDGTTNDAAALAAACPPGKNILQPSGDYRLNSNVPAPSVRCNVIAAAGVTYSGSGEMQPLITNTFQKRTHSYLYAKAKGGSGYGQGMQTFAAEVEADPDYLGNPVAIYAGAVTPGLVPLKSNFLAFNLVATANPGPLAGGSIVGAEFDYNNYNSDNFGGALHLTGASSFNPQYAILIDHLYDPSKPVHYEAAIIVRNFRTGILIDGTTQPPADTTANAVGIQIQGIKQNLLVMTPKDNAPGAAFYVTNADASQVPFIVDKNGDVTSAGKLTSATLATSGAATFGSVSSTQITANGYRLYDDNTTLAAGPGKRLQMSSYYGIELRGGRLGPAPVPTNGNGADAAVFVYGMSGNTQDIMRWLNNDGSAVRANLSATGILNTQGYSVSGTAGVSCIGTPTPNFRSVNGIVTVC